MQVGTTAIGRGRRDRMLVRRFCGGDSGVGRYCPSQHQQRGKQQQTEQPRDTPFHNGATPPRHDGSGHCNFTVRSRSALPITLTEESAIAAAAMAGDSSRPSTG